MSRRKRASFRRGSKPPPRTQASRRPPPESYRVPPGRIACTIDFEGLDPVTIAIEAEQLTAALVSMDAVFAGQSYGDVLSVFATLFRSGNTDAYMAAYWIAARHPQGGTSFRNAISAALRREGSAHVTVHVGAAGGVAIAVAQQFADLSAALDTAKQAMQAVIVERERDQETFQ